MIDLGRLRDIDDEGRCLKTEMLLPALRPSESISITIFSQFQTIMTSPKLLEAVNQTSEQQFEQFKSFSKIYNTLSELCFTQCVWDFGTEEVRAREDRCAMRCTEQYMKSSKVMGDSFTENHPANFNPTSTTDQSS